MATDRYCTVIQISNTVLSLIMAMILIRNSTNTETHIWEVNPIIPVVYWTLILKTISVAPTIVKAGQVRLMFLGKLSHGGIVLTYQIGDKSSWSRVRLKSDFHVASSYGPMCSRRQKAFMSASQILNALKMLNSWTILNVLTWITW